LHSALYATCLANVDK